MYLIGWCEIKVYIQCVKQWLRYGMWGITNYYLTIIFTAAEWAEQTTSEQSVAATTGSWVLNTRVRSYPPKPPGSVTQPLLPKKHRTLQGQTEIRCSRKGTGYWERCFPQVFQSVLSPLGNNYATSKMAVLLILKYRAKEHLPGGTGTMVF